MMRGLIFAIAATLAGAASAQQPDANLDAARAIIERAQLGDVFAPFEHEQIATRHSASGLVCRFYASDTRSEVVVFSGNRPRGEDVGEAVDHERDPGEAFGEEDEGHWGGVKVKSEK